MANTQNKYEITDDEYLNLQHIWIDKCAKQPKTDKWKSKVRGRKFTEEHKLKIGLSNMGKKRPDLAEYNRRTKTGIKRSQESIQKFSMAISGENSATRKPVRNVDTGEVFICAKDAANSVDGSSSGLSYYLNRRKTKDSTYHGYRWEYCDK